MLYPKLANSKIISTSLQLTSKRHYKSYKKFFYWSKDWTSHHALILGQWWDRKEEQVPGEVLLRMWTLTFPRLVVMSPSHQVMSSLGTSCPIQKLASSVTVHNFPRLVVLSPSHQVTSSLGMLCSIWKLASSVTVFQATHDLAAQWQYN